ncbi:MAG: TRAP transporter substrate-binding protein [Deltaproteobacteria bacterium]|nr:TRAP transporter substrate-binding protein [Deltaproteobacteria bacterium]
MSKTWGFRIIICLVMLLSFALFTGQARAADEVKLTFASALAPKSNIELAAKRYAEIIGKKSDGRIQITHYGAGSLYNHKDMIPALAKNQVNMAVHHVAMVGRRSAALEFISSFGAQGAWSSFDHYYRFIDQPEVREIAGGEFDKYFNAKLLGFLAYGAGLVARSDKAVKTVEDYKGFKMRTSGTAQATVYKALGAITVEMSSKEIYTAIQRGTIQGCTTGTSRVRRARLYEVAPYITIDPTLPFMSFYLVINKDVWQKMSAADQKLLTEEARELEKWTRDYVVKEYQEDLDMIKSKAKILYDMPAAEKEKLVAVVRPAMMEFSKKRLGKWYEQLWTLFDKAK